MYNPNAPRPIEVFHLSDAANTAIPEDIREQFHCDDQGHVLFFSSPPLDIVPSVQQRLGHSLKYLAAKEERRKLVEQKKRKETSGREGLEKNAKRQRADNEMALAAKVEDLTTLAIGTMTSQIELGTDAIYKLLYPNQAEQAKAAANQSREQKVLADHASRKRTAQILAHSEGPSFVSLKGDPMYMHGIDPGI